MNRNLSLLLLATLLAAGCVFYGSTAETTDTKSWPAAGVALLDVRVDNGAITVTAGADTAIAAIVTRSCRGTSQTDAENHLDDITFGDSLSGAGLFLWAKAPQPNTRSYNSKYDITQPAATALNIIAANGAIELHNTAAPASIVASNGAVRVFAHQAGINVVASNGAIDCDIAALDSADLVSLRSSNGRVTLTVPADASLAFDLTTSNGTVTVEGFTGVSYSVNESKHKVGTIGAGVALATLRSDNGTVNLKAR